MTGAAISLFESDAERVFILELSAGRVAMTRPQRQTAAAGTPGCPESFDSNDFVTNSEYLLCRANSL